MSVRAVASSWFISSPYPASSPQLVQVLEFVLPAAGLPKDYSSESRDSNLSEVAAINGIYIAPLSATDIRRKEEAEIEIGDGR